MCNALCRTKEDSVCIYTFQKIFNWIHNLEVFKDFDGSVKFMENPTHCQCLLFISRKWCLQSNRDDIWQTSLTIIPSIKKFYWEICGFIRLTEANNPSTVPFLRFFFQNHLVHAGLACWYGLQCASILTLFVENLFLLSQVWIHRHDTLILGTTFIHISA